MYLLLLLLLLNSPSTLLFLSFSLALFFCLLFVVLYFYIYVYSRRRSCECAATLEQFLFVWLGRALWTVFILEGVFCGVLWLFVIPVLCMSLVRFYRRNASCLILALCRPCARIPPLGLILLKVAVQVPIFIVVLLVVPSHR